MVAFRLRNWSNWTDFTSIQLPPLEILIFPILNLGRPEKVMLGTPGPGFYFVHELCILKQWEAFYPVNFDSWPKWGELIEVTIHEKHENNGENEKTNEKCQESKLK